MRTLNAEPRRVTRRSRLGAPQGVAILVALTTLVWVQLPTPAAVSSRERVRILVASASEIDAFAEDGGDIAWITRGGRCGDRLHIRANGRTRTINRIACTDNPDQSELLTGELAFANGRALWNVGCGFSNSVTDYCLRTASFADPKVREVPCCVMDGGLEYGPTYLPLAGRGRTLVYYSHWDAMFSPNSVSSERAIRQVVGSRTRKLFHIDRPLDLSVDGGRIAAVQANVVLGDGCGCNGPAAWSPDGKRLAVVRAPDEAHAIGIDGVWNYINAGLASMNSDGSGVTWLKDPASTHADAVDWSNDGSRLVYTHWSDSQSSEVIAVANADGSGERDIAKGENPKWSPAADTILFESGTGISTVKTVNADGTGLRVLAKGEQASWSPDGQRIVFAGSQGGLYVMRFDGSAVHRILKSSYVDDPAWSPDGRRIAYSYGGLHTMNADGSRRRRLTSPLVERAPYFAHVGATDRWPDWSPDGHTIVFTRVRTVDRDSSGIYYEGGDVISQGEIYTVAATGGDAPRPVTFSTPNRWQTSGQIRRPGRAQIVKYGPYGVPDAVSLAGPVVAVTTVLAGGRKQISVFDARTGTLRRSFAVPSATGPYLGLNRRWIVFSVGRTIRAIDLATNTRKILARLNGDPFDLSVLGRRVAWAENSHGHGIVRAILLP